MSSNSLTEKLPSEINLTSALKDVPQARCLALSISSVESHGPTPFAHDVNYCPPLPALCSVVLLIAANLLSQK